VGLPGPAEALLRVRGGRSRGCPPRRPRWTGVMTASTTGACLEHRSALPTRPPSPTCRNAEVRLCPRGDTLHTHTPPGCRLSDAGHALPAACDPPPREAGCSACAEQGDGPAARDCEAVVVSRAPRCGARCWPRGPPPRRRPAGRALRPARNRRLPPYAASKRDDVDDLWTAEAGDSPGSQVMRPGVAGGDCHVANDHPRSRVGAAVHDCAATCPPVRVISSDSSR
jgi:hypothetical protein